MAIWEIVFLFLVIALFNFSKDSGNITRPPLILPSPHAGSLQSNPAVIISIIIFFSIYETVFYKNMHDGIKKGD